MEQQPQAAEALATEPVECSDSCDHAGRSLRHPFDPETSGRNPFPAFEESMAQTSKADEDDDDDEEDCAETDASSGRVNLNWSIDSLATFKPMEFSPLPEQKAAAEAGAAGLTTPESTQHSRFFEDETQFQVLQTPSDAAQQQQKPLLSATRRPRPGAPASTPETNSSSHSSVLLPTHLPRTPLHELHARCRQAITFHEERLRERQHKMNRLQLPLHTLARAKKKPKQTSTRVAKQCSPSSFPQHSSFSASPGSGPSFQCGLSPVPVFDRASASRALDEQEQEETKTNDNDDALSCIERDTASPEGPSFASLTFSPSEDEDDKENRRRQPRSVSFAPSSSASSPSPSSTSLDRSLSLLVDVTPEKQRPVTIAQRQQSFLAAIEAEAVDKRASSSPPPPTLAAGEPKSSSPVGLNVLGSSARANSGRTMTIPELYQEAKTLGISEPSAQWEYVQIMTRKR